MSGALSEVPGTIRRHLIAHHSPLIKAIVAVPLLARVRNRCWAQMQPPAPRRGCSPSPSSPPSGGKQLPACVCTPAASVPGPAGNPCPPPVSLTQPCLQVRTRAKPVETHHIAPFKLRPFRKGGKKIWDGFPGTKMVLFKMNLQLCPADDGFIASARDRWAPCPGQGRTSPCLPRTHGRASVRAPRAPSPTTNEALCFTCCPRPCFSTC